MERAKVECAASLLLELTSEAFDFTLTNLVRQRLAGPDDIAVDLVNSLTFGQSDVVEEEVDRPLARPSLIVNPGIHHQAARTPGLVAQHPEARQRVGVEPELVGQALGVQRPALDKGCRQPTIEAAECRHVLQLLSKG